MIEKKISELLARIDSKNLSLTQDDTIILELYPEINKKIFPLLSESLEYWNNIDIDKILDEASIIYITPEISDNFWINYVKYQINKKNEYLPEQLDEILGIITVKEETKIIITELITNFAKENLIIRLEDNEILTLLEAKRFDLISKIDKYYSNRISEETMERLINVFPYEQYESPKFFASYPKQLEKIIEKVSLKTIVTLIYNQEYRRENNYEIPIEILQEQLIIKLKQKKLKEPKFLEEKISDIISIIPFEIIPEIADITAQNNILDFIPQYYNNHPEAREFCCQKIIDYFNKTNDKEFFKDLNAIIIENEILVDSLIENGFIEGLINNNIIVKYPNKEQQIIENIQKRNPKYNRNEVIALSSNSYSYNYLNILQELINAGILKKITLYESYNLSDHTIDFITKVIKENPNIEIDGIVYSNIINNLECISQIIVEWLKEKKYFKVLEILCIFYDSISTEFIKKHEDLIIESIEESLFFSTNLIKKIPKLIIENKRILATYFNEPFLSSELINYINHHEEYEYMYNHETYLIARETLSINLKIDVERLDKFEQKFGPKIIRYINNENILKLLKLNDIEFTKFLELFPNVEYKISDLESAYDSLKQYEFSKKHINIINIFPTILHAIEDQNNEVLQNAITEIANSLDEQFFKEANQKYEFPEGYDQTNPKLLVTFIIEKIKHSEGDKKEKYINILHDITNYYISRKRREYRDTYDMIGELKLPYTLDSKSADSEYLKLLIQESYYHYIYWISEEKGYQSIKLANYLVKKLEEYDIERTLGRELVHYYTNKDQHSYGYSEDVLKANYKYLIKAMTEIAKEEPQHDIFKNEYNSQTIMRLDNEGRIKRKYNTGPTGIDIYELLTSLRIDALQNCVLSNEEVYKSLKTILLKKKIHLLPEALKNMLGKEEINISDDLTNIAGFISYYGHIYAKEKSTLASNNRPTNNININFTNILINAEVYSGVSSVYSQILGDEDAKLIKANPGPNSATSKLANNRRLKEAIELTEIMYRKKYVTIPTFNESFTLTGNKTLRVIVGNFTHPSTLTHGERTGACMRIGGVGESLFQFAINNPNGFHIRFENPENSKYISRVTGFRNGNTVFLNELRNSCDPDNYTDENIIEACKKAAEMLIELSKNSPCPIENVVIHRAYATRNARKNVSLNVKDIKKGLPHFYSDVNSTPIVLATIAKNGLFVPVNLDNSSVPSYLPAREIPSVFKEGSKASGMISRISSIKRMLEGENYEHIPPLEFENGITYAIVSEDWYIYVDELGNIHKDIIDIDPRAKEELAESLIKLEENLDSIIIDRKEANYGL